MRRLQLTPDELNKTVTDLIKKLMKSGKPVTISPATLTTLAPPKVKPTIHFTELAWTKMTKVVAAVPSELAWHATVHRGEGLHFVVDDIFVYPQLVTSATVESDDEHYDKWLNDLPDDIFNNIRLQGHSHVNMTSSPSGTDDQFYETLVPHIKDFYIFMIINKRSEIWVNLYDVASGVVYDNYDIKCTYDSDTTLDQWLEESVMPKLTKHSFKPKGKQAEVTVISSKSFFQNQSDYNIPWNERNY